MKPMTALGADLSRILVFAGRDGDLGGASLGTALFAATGKGPDYHVFSKGY